MTMAADTFQAQPPLLGGGGRFVERQTIRKAVDALVKWRAATAASKKPKLIPGDDFVYLNLTLKKIPPKARTNPFRIPLPHPLLSPPSDGELCLIIDDRPTSKSEGDGPTLRLTSGEAKEIIQSQNIPISKVIKLSKLKTDYKPYEAKRKLCGSYDMFFVDKRLVPLLPKLLGKTFFKKKKLPLPVDLTHKNWKEQIEKGCSSALLYLREGTCSVVKLGKVSMESEEIVENVVAAIDGIVEVLPKKWAAIRSLHLKFSDSVALPLYQALPDLKLKIKGAEEKEMGVEEVSGGELVVKEKVKDEVLGRNKGRKKKGRIHEVTYMDVDMSGDDLGIDDDDGNGNESENDEFGNAELLGKKRKKGDNGKELDTTKLDGEKRANKKGKLDVVKGGDDDEVDQNEGLDSENGKQSNAKQPAKRKLNKDMGDAETNKKKKKDGLASRGGDVSDGKKVKKKKRQDGRKLKGSERNI